MQFCFIGEGVSLVMPVTPGTYQWSVGKRMETINISELGDVYRPGGRARFSGGFEFLLPTQEYPWMEAGSRADPQYYLDYLTTWAKEDKTVRLIITGTEINARYVTVSVREYTSLEAAEVSSGGAGGGRASVPSVAPTSGSSGQAQSYTIAHGDTLSVICRRYYGQSTAKYYNALAKYNGIKNPHLIHTGAVLKIPAENALLGVTS